MSNNEPTDGGSCPDEGCPHYGTPHSHPTDGGVTDAMIAQLRDGEWWQTVVRGSNPTGFSTDQTALIRNVADRLAMEKARSPADEAFLRKALIAELIACTETMGFDLGGNDFAYVANRLLIGPLARTPSIPVPAKHDPAADEGLVERVRDAVIAAWQAGAHAVHAEWAEADSEKEYYLARQGHPDFTEAAHDYAALQSVEPVEMLGYMEWKDQPND